MRQELWEEPDADNRVLWPGASEAGRSRRPEEPRASAKYPDGAHMEVKDLILIGVSGWLVVLLLPITITLPLRLRPVDRLATGGQPSPGAPASPLLAGICHRDRRADPRNRGYGDGGGAARRD